MLAIQRFFIEFPAHSLRWIPRKQNRSAHNLAKWAAISTCFGFLSVRHVPVAIFNSDLLWVVAGFILAYKINK